MLVYDDRRTRACLRGMRAVHIISCVASGNPCNACYSPLDPARRSMHVLALFNRGPAPRERRVRTEPATSLRAASLAATEDKRRWLVLRSAPLGVGLSGRWSCFRSAPLGVGLCGRGPPARGIPIHRGGRRPTRPPSLTRPPPPPSLPPPPLRPSAFPAPCRASPAPFAICQRYPLHGPPPTHAPHHSCRSAAASAADP